MRILHTGDWHLGRSLEGRSRIPEQVAFIEELCEIVKEEKIDLLLLAGDIFDTVNPPAAAEELYYHALAEFTNENTRSVVIIAGNHDSPERLRAPGPMVLRHGVHLLGLPGDTQNAPLVINLPHLDYPLYIAALPFPSESRLNQALTSEVGEEGLQKAYTQKVGQIFAEMSQGFRRDGVCLALSHLYVMGGEESGSERPIQLGTASAVSTSDLPESAQYVALGHLHRPQEVAYTKTPTRYSGSPLAYSFNEAGQAKSVTIIEAKPNEEVSIEEVFLSAGKPLLRWRATEGLKQVEYWCEEGRDKNAWIDLELVIEAPLSGEEIYRLRSLHPGFINIRPIISSASEVAAAQDIKKEMPPEKLFRRFYYKMYNTTPQDELVNLFLELLEEQDGQEASE